MPAEPWRPVQGTGVTGIMTPVTCDARALAQPARCRHTRDY